MCYRRSSGAYPLDAYVYLNTRNQILSYRKSIAPPKEPDESRPFQLTARRLKALMLLKPFEDKLLRQRFGGGIEEEEASLRDIGNAEGVPPSTIQRRLRRRLAKLRAKIEWLVKVMDGGDAPAGLPAFVPPPPADRGRRGKVVSAHDDCGDDADGLVGVSARLPKPKPGNGGRGKLAAAVQYDSRACP